MKLNEEHKKKRTQNWGELICELDCSRRQKNETKTTKLQWKQESDFLGGGGGGGGGSSRFCLRCCCLSVKSKI